MESRDLRVRTSLSATTTLPLRASTAASPAAPGLRDSASAPKEGGVVGGLDLASCAARLESQFNRVLARQNVQDETMAALNHDLAEINAKLSLLHPDNAVKTATRDENVSPTMSADPTSPPVPALKAKLEREVRELALAQVTGSRDTSQLYRLEARMDQQDANIRALTMAVETLAAKIAQQTKQLAIIAETRPDEEIAALRDELADMSKWCARFNAAHDRTLSRCAALEEKLAVANLDLARLRIDAVTRERKAKEGESGDEHETNKEVGELNITRRLQNAAPTKPATPVHRQIASLKPPPKTYSDRPLTKPAPSLPELPPNSPFTLKM